MRGWGIRLQVLLLALVPTLIISVLLVAYFTSTRLDDLEQAFRDRGEAIAMKLALASSYPLLSQNKNALQVLTLSTQETHEILGVAIYNEKGVEMARAGTINTTFRVPNTSSAHIHSIVESDNSTAFFVPILKYPTSVKIASPKIASKALVNDHDRSGKSETSMITPSDGKVIGWIGVALDARSMHLREHEVLIHTTMLLLLGLSISGLHALQMGRNVTRPILELAQVVERIKHGELGTRAPISNYRELYVLETGINTMSKALQDARAELQNEVNEATASLRRSLETIEIQNLELEIARQAAEANSQIKSEFLANMSHEIRTPLNGVVGFTNLLKRTPLVGAQREYVDTIQKSSKTLLSIINDILDFSKIEAGKLRIERQRMDIRECVEETLTLLAPYSAEKSLVLVPLVYSNVPRIVLGDPLRIKQVITNLANNAIKFTERGSVIVRVTVESEEGNQAILRIAVIDTGVGLSLQEQQELFQAFHQVNVSLSQKAGGTGLGLVICKKLVEQMKGEIGLESELGRGSTFWFTFEVGKISEVQPALVTKPVGSLPFTHKIRALAVDDNPDNLRLITLLLGELGIETLAAASGQEAVDVAKMGGFDLIFMDIRMPGMDGMQATQLIREHEQHKSLLSTPIIALTAHALISEQEGLLAAGIDDYLTKPIDEDQLRKIIAKWTHGGHNKKTGALDSIQSARISLITDNNHAKNPVSELNLTPSMPSQNDIFDWSQAVKLAGGKVELAKELFNKLCDSFTNDFIAIQNAFSLRDWKLLRDEVHRLHGACCYCGVPKLKRCLQTLEGTLGMQPTVESIEPMLVQLSLFIDEVRSISINSFACEPK